MTEPLTEAGEEEERHASWAELFFDLVAVAGIAMLAHTMLDPTRASLALFTLCFVAFWTTWVSFMLYGNAVGETLRLGRLLQGMFGLAVMAAALPGLTEWVHEPGQGRPIQAVVFALAFVATRWVAAGSWQIGQLVLDWPLAQSFTGALPWLASIWAPDDWTLRLWTLGLLIDVLVLMFLSASDITEHAEERWARVEQQLREKSSEATRERHPLADLSPVSFEPGHLTERLSLFVIIVLGEGVMQSVAAASGATWDWALLGAGIAALLMLANLWGLSVIHGHAGSTRPRPLRGLATSGP